MNSYKELLKIKSYETDINAYLKLYSFMNFAQEIAGLHADSLGFGYDSLIKNGIAWVLSRVHVKFNRVPVWKEEISIETWHKGSDRLFGYRDFEVLDKDGKKIIIATSSWLLINIETRRLHRINNIMEENTGDNGIRHAIKEPAERLVSPAEMEFARTRFVSFSDVDINRHTNNAKYIEWALDCLDLDLITKMKVTGMTINFNTESRVGDEITFYTAFNGQNKSENSCKSVFIEGKRGDTSVFQVFLEYQL